MAETSDFNPHIRNVNSPLETLILQALRRFGDYAPSTASGDTIIMFIEFANQIIDEVRMHPYWDGTEIDYYEHPSEARAIPDNIIVSGLLFHYAMQQASEKFQMYSQSYIRTMNQERWRRLNGGNTKIQMRVMDNGSNPHYVQDAKTSQINGLLADDTKRYQ